MLSDDSSSDSETGRFKGSSEKKDNDEQKGRSHQRTVDRHHKLSSRRDESYKRRSPERHRSRYSPNRRQRRSSSSRKRHSSCNRKREKHSRERSLDRYKRSTQRQSVERHRSTEKNSSENRKSSEKNSSNKPKYSNQQRSSHRHRSRSREKQELHTNKSPYHKSTKTCRNGSSDRDSTATHKVKKSEVYKASPVKLKTTTPEPMETDAHEDVKSDVIQPASYYSMLPKVEEKTDQSSVTDSSDDEKLRAKLLNLEKKLDKSKKKKHRKKHKRKSKSKNKDTEVTNVEVSSTTDIQENVKASDVYIIESDTPEITSTQPKPDKGEGSEEGEITSDNNDSHEINKQKPLIDSNDLRHKLKNHNNKISCEISQGKGDMCGPVLPPHLQKRLKKSVSPEVEGPALPPHLKHKEKKIGL